MATPTYDLLNSSVLGSAASSVTFSSIPQSYADLVLVMKPLYVGTEPDINIEFNGDTNNANYKAIIMRSNNTSSTSFEVNSRKIATLSDNSMLKAEIFNYSNSAQYKNLLIRSGFLGSNKRTEHGAMRWNNSAAITQIKILAGVNFPAGSTFYLYGIGA